LCRRWGRLSSFSRVLLHLLPRPHRQPTLYAWTAPTSRGMPGGAAIGTWDSCAGARAGGRRPTIEGLRSSPGRPRHTVRVGGKRAGRSPVRERPPGAGPGGGRSPPRGGARYKPSPPRRVGGSRLSFPMLAELLLHLYARVYTRARARKYTQARGRASFT